MSDKPAPPPTLHGETREDIARTVLRMSAALNDLEKVPGGPDARLRALDDIYLQGSHLERMALREVAFMRICGVVT